MSAPIPNGKLTLIDELLAEQQQLAAVERFSRHHDSAAATGPGWRYRELIPLSRPQPGQQYTFEVDLDKCSGCKACVSACHSLNGLDEGESWRDVGLLFSADWRQPFQQTITTACHHCEDPACLNGCPVLAYDKDPLTGIVRHLDDQCIGCQYCVMKCPYDVPKYSAKRGIVRKCDLCASRLAVNEAPACAQACPNEAIRITLVERVEIVAAAQADRFLPGSPDPRYTLPSTRYKSSRPVPANLLAGDHAQVAPAASHLPLAFMLVLTQLGVGAAIAAVFLEPAKWLTLTGCAISALGLMIASLHLGKPLKAWRSFLGWRTSWFSREVIVFSLFVPLAGLAAFVSGRDDLQSPALWLKIAAALAGIAGVVCSAMIYADTRREFWRATQSFGKFLGTTLLLGLAAVLAVDALTQPGSNAISGLLAGGLAAVTLTKLGFERRIFLHWVDDDTPTLSSLNKTARLLAGQLGFLSRVRIACAMAGGTLLPALLVLNQDGGVGAVRGLAFATLLLLILGELLERHLFFKAVAPVKMPGAVTA